MVPGAEIVLPAIVLALATIALYPMMFRARVAAVKAGEAQAGDFRLRTHEPDRSRAVVNAIANQYETPVLFYAVVVLTFVTGEATLLMMLLAWAYVVAKLVHVGIFVTSNRLRWRMRAFGVSLAILALMWIVFALQLVF